MSYPRIVPFLLYPVFLFPPFLVQSSEPSRRRSAVKRRAHRAMDETYVLYVRISGAGAMLGGSLSSI